MHDPKLIPGLLVPRERKDYGGHTDVLGKWGIFNNIRKIYFTAAIICLSSKPLAHPH